MKAFLKYNCHRLYKDQFISFHWYLIITANAWPIKNNVKLELVLPRIHARTPASPESIAGGGGGGGPGALLMGEGRNNIIPESFFLGRTV